MLSSCTILEPSKYPADSGKIILTFDDGPSREVSSQLLDVLRETGTKAVFCYIGENVEENPEITARAIEEGHQVVMHTFSHTAQSLLSPFTLKRETEDYIRLFNALESSKPAPLEYFRPPLGIKTPAVRSIVKGKEFKYAHLTFFVNDASTTPQTATALMDKIKKRIVKNNGGAIVLHEMRFKANSNKYAVDKSWLPEAIRELTTWARSNGYSFTTYDSVMAD